MKIGILSQPLLNNYGGVLQNYALQLVLRRMNHSPVTIDYIPVTPLWRCFLSWIKTILYMCLGKETSFRKKELKRDRFFIDFVDHYIDKTSVVHSYDAAYNQDKFDVLIVGSDQVWRPKYNFCIKDMFFDFCKNDKIKRLSYAASFGCDEWEFTRKQTVACSFLAKKIFAVSVREESGINLCRTYLGIDAEWVLDPTFLLKKEDYCDICKNIEKIGEKILVAYILNIDDSIKSRCESVAKERGLILKFFTADSKASLTVPEWLAMFRDASYVITDSFHGTVFSIIFGKEFFCVYNKKRGSARFESLLKLYNSGKLDEMRVFSINWLKKALDS